MRASLLSAILTACLMLSACAQSGSIFPQLTDQIATPSAIGIDVASNRMYLVNSNAKVLYDWTEGSFQVYDITDPLAPTLIKTMATDSFSGQVYLDLVRMRAFVPNRYSTDASVTVDRLYSFDINEGGGDLLGYIEGPAGRDAYAIDCCYPVDRAWITTSLGELQYVDLNDITVQPGSVDLKSDLSTGGNLSHAEVSHIARRDPQSFLSRDYGGVIVVNLDDAGVAGENAVDYFINDIPNPRGIAIRGNTLYVVGEGDECGGDWCRFLMLLDVSTLTPRTGNATAEQLDKDDAGLLIATIQVGLTPQEVLLTQDYAFVTNQDDDTVSVIDLATNAVVATIAVGVGADSNDDEPFSLALYTTLGGVDQYVYVGNVESNTISIIDVPTLTVAATYNGP